MSGDNKLGCLNRQVHPRWIHFVMYKSKKAITHFSRYFILMCFALIETILNNHLMGKLEIWIYSSIFWGSRPFCLETDKMFILSRARISVISWIFVDFLSYPAVKILAQFRSYQYYINLNCSHLRYDLIHQFSIFIKIWLELNILTNFQLWDKPIL